MPIQLLMGFLVKYQPQLLQPYKVLQSSRFVTEGPGYVPGRKSRIGDTIYLIEGSKAFMKGLSEFPENYRFKMSPTWRITIRGGERAGQAKKGNGDSDDLELSEYLQSLVMTATADEMMEKSKKTMGNDGAGN